VVSHPNGVLTIRVTPSTVSSVPDERDAVLGVNIASGVAYLALARKPAALELGGTAKIAPASNVEHWSALAAFGERLVAESKARNVAVVAFADPKKQQKWVYSQARTRVELVTAAAMALRVSGVGVEVVSQHTAAASLKLPYTKELEASLKAKYIPSEDKVLHWNDRAAAVLVALCVATRRWS
jgi:hypothetical protein